MNIETPQTDASLVMKRRYLTGELIRGLREGSRYWQGVIIDQDPPTYHSGKSSKFRFLGIGRGSPSGPTPDYFVFRFKTRQAIIGTPAGPLNVLPHRLILSEPALDSALKKLQKQGLYCGVCGGFDEADRGNGYSCTFAQLLSSPHLLFLNTEKRVRRNSTYITEEMLLVAVVLFDSTMCVAGT